MIQGRHISLDVDTKNGFWAFQMLQLSGQGFVRAGEIERCPQARDRTREPRMVPSLCYTREQFDLALQSRPGRMPWICTGFYSDTYSLVLRLQRWTARVRSEGLLKDVYVPLPGSRAGDTALLPKFNFHSSADLPACGLYKDAKFKGTSACELNIGAIDIGRNNFVSQKNARLKLGKGNYEVVGKDKWKACSSATFYATGLPSAVALEQMEQERMKDSGYQRLHGDLSHTRKNTVNPDTLRKHFDTRRQKRSLFGQEIFTALSAKLKLRTHQERQIATARLTKEISETLQICFVGDANVNNGATRGHRTVPQKALLTQLATRVPVVIVNEAYTSCRCSKCCSESQKLRTVYATEAAVKNAREKLRQAERDCRLATKALCENSERRRTRADRRAENENMTAAKKKLNDATKVFQRHREALEWYTRVMEKYAPSGVRTRRQVEQDVLRQFLHSRTVDRRVECCLNEDCMEMFLHDENSTENIIQVAGCTLCGRPRPAHLTRPRDEEGIS